MINLKLRKSKINPESIKKALKVLTPFERVEFLTALINLKYFKRKGHEVRILSKEKITPELINTLKRLLP